MSFYKIHYGKVSEQPLISLCIQFMYRFLHPQQKFKADKFCQRLICSRDTPAQFASGFKFTSPGFICSCFKVLKSTSFAIKGNYCLTGELNLVQMKAAGGILSFHYKRQTSDTTLFIQPIFPVFTCDKFFSAVRLKIRPPWPKFV